MVALVCHSGNDTLRPYSAAYEYHCTVEFVVNPGCSDCHCTHIHTLLHTQIIIYIYIYIYWRRICSVMQNGAILLFLNRC